MEIPPLTVLASWVEIRLNQQQLSLQVRIHSLTTAVNPDLEPDLPSRLRIQIFNQSIYLQKRILNFDE